MLPPRKPPPGKLSSTSQTLARVDLVPKPDGFFNKLFVFFVVTLIGVSFCFYGLGIHSHKQAGQDNFHDADSQNEQMKGTEATGKIILSLIFGCAVFMLVNMYINCKKNTVSVRKTNFMSKYKKELQANCGGTQNCGSNNLKDSQEKSRRNFNCFGNFMEKTGSFFGSDFSSYKKSVSRNSTMRRGQNEFGIADPSRST